MGRKGPGAALRYFVWLDETWLPPSSNSNDRFRYELHAVDLKSKLQGLFDELLLGLLFYDHIFVGHGQLIHVGDVHALNIPQG